MSSKKVKTPSQAVREVRTSQKPAKTAKERVTRRRESQRTPRFLPPMGTLSWGRVGCPPGRRLQRDAHGKGARPRRLPARRTTCGQPQRLTDPTRGSTSCRLHLPRLDMASQRHRLAPLRAECRRWREPSRTSRQLSKPYNPTERAVPGPSCSADSQSYASGGSDSEDGGEENQSASEEAEEEATDALLYELKYDRRPCDKGFVVETLESALVLLGSASFNFSLHRRDQCANLVGKKELKHLLSEDNPTSKHLFGDDFVNQVKNASTSKKALGGVFSSGGHYNQKYNPKKDFGTNPRDNWVLDTIQGYRLELSSQPSQIHIPVTKVRPGSDTILIDQEVEKLLSKGAIQRALPTTDLKDAYFTVPIFHNHRKYLRFIWKDSLYEFAVLPFGLSSAPRVFTKILKPIAAQLRALGVRLVIYLDDIDNGTKCRSMQRAHGSDPVLLREPGVCSQLGEVAVNTIPNKGVPRVHYLLSEDGSPPAGPESTEDSGSMSKPTIEGKSLPSRTSEPSRVVVFNQPSGATGTPTLPLPTERSTSRSQEVGTLQQCDSSFSDGTTGSVLVAEIANKLERGSTETTNSPGSTKRCLPPGMGRILPRKKGGGAMVKPGEGRPHQCLRTESSLPFPSVLCPKCSKRTGKNEAGQHHSCGVYQSERRHQISSVDEAQSRNVELGSTKGLMLTASHVEGAKNQIADTLSRVFNDRTEWQLNPEVFRNLSEFMPGVTIDLFASRLNAQLPRYVAWMSDPAAVAVGCLHHRLGTGNSLRLSPHSTDPTNPEQGGTGSGHNVPPSPSVADSSVVPANAGTIVCTTSATSQIRGSDQVTTQRTNTSVLQKVRLALWPLCGTTSKVQAFRLGLQTSCCPHGGKGTKKQYKGAWHRWVLWCNSRNKNPFSSSINDVLDYLHSLYARGLEYRSIGVARSAISAVHAPIDGVNVGAHPYVVKLMKGVFQSRPHVQDTCHISSGNKFHRTLDQKRDEPSRHRYCPVQCPLNQRCGIFSSREKWPLYYRNLRAADWSSESTFATFYKRDLEESDFGESEGR
ncbi:hypothetical protein Bbelb_020240 [Branchiostoma belcheri]|nr:hypothetical protein Bbelb_020240 [Branchiostoma belcheri]